MLGTLKSIASVVGIALFCITTGLGFKKKDSIDANSIAWKGLCWSPLVCFLFVAFMEYTAGDVKSASTWLVIGVVNFFLNSSMILPEEDK